ncbi:hypothetical protein PACTADRAFT_47450 [Pachysolen tannophilus NRRL Y-2460]|uniref:Copper transporter n=1 Tax=Pachysolen tannophilus NRRL Y-2460 TaxID=669874 RepID=A0A1E4U0U1_PACTA|nr:hypothetical protein PACTADRAFT_47450 [Pachysolen tannophilus NRRL Y-2460]
MEMMKNISSLGNMFFTPDQPQEVIYILFLSWIILIRMLAFMIAESIIVQFFGNKWF